MTWSPRSTLLALAVAFPMATVAAQGSPTFGLLGGLTSSKVSIDADIVEVSLGSRTGFAVGGSAQFPLSELVSLEVDALYSQKGFEVTESGVTLGLRLAYIEVPVLLRYEIGAASTRPFLMVGGSVGFKASCDLSGDTGPFSASAGCNEVVNEDQKSIDIGGTIGAGLRFNRLSIQARYTHGLSEVFDEGSEAASIKNRTLFFLAGISF